MSLNIKISLPDKSGDNAVEGNGTLEPDGKSISDLIAFLIAVLFLTSELKKMSHLNE